jgi:hypothetical protein
MISGIIRICLNGGNALIPGISGLRNFKKHCLSVLIALITYYTYSFDETIRPINKSRWLSMSYFGMLKVKTFYMTSIAMGHSKELDLLEAFYKSTEKLDLSKLLQTSIDGPAVNWKYYGWLVGFMGLIY